MSTKEHPIRQHPTLGCCGLDCGLCPRYHTAGDSRCPGCCGLGFAEKHPGCTFTRCCARDRGLEVCALCPDYPCQRFDKEGRYDSFVTHRKVLENQAYIIKHGLEAFLKQQAGRIDWLEEMLLKYNEGRSKNLYCLAATLLPSDVLEQSAALFKKNLPETADIKTQAQLLRTYLNEAADRHNVKLALRRKPED